VECNVRETVRLENGDDGEFQPDEGDDELEIDGGEYNAEGADVHPDCNTGGWEVQIRPDMLPTL
jgi:hypothetical protein